MALALKACGSFMERLLSDCCKKKPSALEKQQWNLSFASYTSDERMIYFCRGSDFLKWINFLDLGAFKSQYFEQSPHKYMMIISASIVKKVPFFQITCQEMSPACFLHHLSAGNRAAIRFSRIGKFSQFAFATEKFEVWGGVDLDWCCGTP